MFSDDCPAADARFHLSMKATTSSGRRLVRPIFDKGTSLSDCIRFCDYFNTEANMLKVIIP